MKFVYKFFTVFILFITVSTAIKAEEAKRLHTVFSERGFDTELRPLFSDYGAFGTSLHIEFPSDRTEESRTLLIALPQNNNADIGTDSTYTAIMLLADMLKESPVPIDLRIAFLADERKASVPADSNAEHTGLRDLLDLYENPKSLSLIYLDLAELSGSLVLRHGAPGYIAPLSLLINFVQCLDTAQIPYSIPVYYNELYRLSLIRGPTALQYALQRSVPALFIESGPPTGPESGISRLAPQELAGLLYSFASTFTEAEPELDYHYTILRYGGFTFFLSETATILCFLIFWTLALFIIFMYSITHRRKLIVMWTVFIRRSWIIVLYFFMLLISLLAASILVTLILGYFSEGAEITGFGAALLKFLMALALFNLLSPLLKLFKIPKRAHYYGNASVFLLSIGTLLTSYFDITFLPVFLWAFIFTFLGAIIHVPQLVFVSALAAPVQIFGILGSAIGEQASVMSSLLGSDSVLINIFMALIVLPFIFNFKRSSLLFIQRKQKVRKLRIWLPRVLFFCGVSAALLSYGMEIQSSRTGDNAIVPESDKTGVLFELGVKSEIFLDRRIINVSLFSDVQPIRYMLSLDAADENRMLIYDAPMPYTISSDGRRADFTLGYDPYNPFITDLVIAADHEVILKATLLYRNEQGLLCSIERTVQVP